MDILEKIVDDKIKQIELEKPKIRDFEAVLRGSGLSIIAEIKKASPSKGIIVEDFNPISIARNYEECGVDAISVLTEKNYFLGNDEYLISVKEQTSKPVLRKDFIVDTFQVYQSLFLGADAILLIAAVLKERLKEFYDLTSSIGLHCLVEVHNEEELELALDCGAKIIGINNRNLKDFHIDLKNTEKLMKQMPKNIITISESGINSIDDLKYLKSIGVNGVLIGETFMRNPDRLKSFLEESHVKG